MKLDSSDMTEIWNFLIAVFLYGSFCFCSNTIHYVSVSDSESNNSRITYFTGTRNSYCKVSFTYLMCCDTDSPRPWNLAWLSDLIDNLSRKCSLITSPPAVLKVVQAGKTRREAKHWAVPWGSQVPRCLWTHRAKPHAVGASLERKCHPCHTRFG